MFHKNPVTSMISAYHELYDTNVPVLQSTEIPG